MSYWLLSERKLKARKPHLCIWCGERVTVGELYVKEVSTYDGHFQNHKWHPECLSACQAEHRGSGEYEFDPHSNYRPVAAEASAAELEPKT